MVLQGEKGVGVRDSRSLEDPKVQSRTIYEIVRVNKIDVLRIVVPHKMFSKRACVHGSNKLIARCHWRTQSKLMFHVFDSSLANSWTKGLQIKYAVALSHYSVISLSSSLALRFLFCPPADFFFSLTAFLSTCS